MLLVQHTFQPRRIDRHHVCLDDAVWYENEFFVKNLTANKIAYPKLVVEVKDIRHNRFYHHMRTGGDLREKMP